MKLADYEQLEQAIEETPVYHVRGNPGRDNHQAARGLTQRLIKVLPMLESVDELYSRCCERRGSHSG